MRVNKCNNAETSAFGELKVEQGNINKNRGLESIKK